MASVSWEINFRSRVRGPISSGLMDDYARDYEAEVAEKIAEEFHDEWMYNLNSRLRHQTPFYTTRIDTRQLAWNRYEVHDHGVVYGHWLEGTGSRNSPVTIFPGYWAHRDAKAEINRKRSSIARRILRQHRARGRLI